MSFTAIEYDLVDLLQQAGARIHGRRADCPWCGGRRTISHADEVYYCHRCEAKGNRFTLARELGLAKRLSPKEVQGYHRIREESKEAAEWAYEKFRSQRLDAAEKCRSFARLVDRASERLKLDPGDKLAWERLAFAYPQLDLAVAEHVLLSEAPIAQRLAFLEASEVEFRQILSDAIHLGGICDGQGRFVVIDVYAPGSALPVRSRSSTVAA
jgi:hypothetical protein